MKLIRSLLSVAFLALALTLFFQGKVLAAYTTFFIGGASLTPWSSVKPVLCNLAIPEHYMRVFNANWDHSVQQEVSVLGNYVTIDDFDGKEKIYTDIDQVEFQERKGRLQKTNRKEVTGDKRKMTRKSFSAHFVFDRDDKQLLGMLGEPRSELIVELEYAFKRSIDDGLVAAASGTVYGGEDPYVTPITLPNTQKVAVDFVFSGVAANSGLTPDKLQRAIKLFEDNNLSITREEFVLAIGPKQKEDLFQYVKTAPSSAYAMMIGEWLRDPSKKLFGFNVLVSTRLASTVVDSNTTVRTCLAWSKRGIYAAPSKMETKVDPLVDLEHATQISAYGQWGFMRRYEERVVEILCDENPAT